MLAVPAWQQLGWAMHSELGMGNQTLISHPTPLLTPGKAQRPAQAGVTKPQILDYRSSSPTFHHLKGQFGFFQHLTSLLRALEIWPKMSVWPEKQFYINNSPTKSPLPALTVSSASVSQLSHPKTQPESLAGEKIRHFNHHCY